MHRVAVLVVPPLPTFEVGVATEAFALARPELDVPWWYELALCAEAPGEVEAVGSFAVRVPHGLEVLDGADTVIVPGAGDVHATPSPPVLAALRRAHARGARVASICSGAFVLAAAGLLDGREAVTHWRYAELLATRFPRVRVRADVLYLDGGDLLTSAGTAAGIDLCLHLIRSDHGAAVANAVARRMVVAPQRGGGQAQFVEAPVAARVDDDPVGRAMGWALERLAEPLAVSDLARVAYMSPRHFSRRFAAATGVSPARWLLEQRLRASLPLLEESDLPVEEVGRRVGFPTPAAFRRHFARARGIPPSAHRRAFGQRAAA
jgi:AraC family transcriptional regulator, transcriptional activator FtrA